MPALSPRSRFGFVLHRGGVTILELLVVLLILLMVTAAAIPIMAPALQNRQMRESARLVSAYFSTARSRAIETGRPVGVMVERFNGQPFAFTLSMVETQPPYAGDTTGARAQVQATMGVNHTNPNLPSSQTHFNDRFNTPTVTTNAQWYTATVDAATDFTPRLVRVGDRIQFDGKGPLYTVFGPDEMPKDGVIDTPMPLGTIDLDVAYLYPTGTTPALAFPWNTTPKSLPFQVIRQPTRSAAAPLQLPEGIVVDLVSSGMGTSGTFNTVNLMGAVGGTPPAPVVPFDPVILFSPTGRLEAVTNATTGTLRAPTDAVYLLLGRRDLMYDVTSRNNSRDIVDQNLSPVPNPANVQPGPPPHFWVAVGYQTGQVTVAEVAANFQDYSGTVATTFNEVVQTSLSQARQFARQSQSVGGR